MTRLKLTTAMLTAALVAAAVALAEPPVVTPDDLAKRLEGDDPPVVLDVRSDEEWNAGHIPGAMHIPVQEITERRGEVLERPEGQLDPRVLRLALAHDAVGSRP